MLILKQITVIDCTVYTQVLLFYFILDKVPGVARGILETLEIIILNFNFFSQFGPVVSPAIA